MNFEWTHDRYPLPLSFDEDDNVSNKQSSQAQGKIENFEMGEEEDFLCDFDIPHIFDEDSQAQEQTEQFNMGEEENVSSAPERFKKAPDAPKRFRSAYILFLTEKYKEIRENLRHAKPCQKKATNFSKVVSKAWKELSPEQRSVWKEKARLDKARYEVEKAMYEGPWTVPAGKRPPKDPRAPKRPMSAFLAFSNSRRALLRQQNPGMGSTELSRKLAEMWKKAPPEVKRQYVEEEARLREQYKIDIAEWRKHNRAEKKNQREQREQLALQTVEAQRSPEETEDEASTLSGSAGTEEQLGVDMQQGYQEEFASIFLQPLGQPPQIPHRPFVGGSPPTDLDPGLSRTSQESFPSVAQGNEATRLSAHHSYHPPLMSSITEPSECRPIHGDGGVSSIGYAGMPSLPHQMFPNSNNADNNIGYPTSTMLPGGNDLSLNTFMRPLLTEPQGVSTSTQHHMEEFQCSTMQQNEYAQGHNTGFADMPSLPHQMFFNNNNVDNNIGVPNSTILTGGNDLSLNTSVRPLLIAGPQGVSTSVGLPCATKRCLEEFQPSTMQQSEYAQGSSNLFLSRSDSLVSFYCQKEVFSNNQGEVSLNSHVEGMGQPYAQEHREAANGTFDFTQQQNTQAHAYSQGDQDPLLSSLIQLTSLGNQPRQPFAVRQDIEAANGAFNFNQQNFQARVYEQGDHDPLLSSFVQLASSGNQGETLRHPIAARRYSEMANSNAFKSRQEPAQSGIEDVWDEDESSLDSREWSSYYFQP